MMDERYFGFVPEFKTEADRSIVRFVFRDEGRLVGYQLEMLKNNRIPLLLNPEILKVDDEIRISYEITSMIPLKKILERKEIGKREFIRYIQQIAGVFDQLENHLLDYGGILFDSSMIFGSPADERIFFIYLPVREAVERDVREPLRQFVTNLIIREMKFRNEESDNYIQHLIEALKSPDFSLETLKAWLAATGGSRMTENPAYITSETSTGTQADTGIPAPAVIPAGNAVRKPEKQDNKQDERKDSVTGVKKVYPISSWIILGAAVAGVMALFAVMGINGAFDPGNPDMVTKTAGLILIGGAVIWLVLSKAFSEDKKIEKQLHEKPKNAKKVGGSIKNTPVPGKLPRFRYVNKSIPHPYLNSRPGEISESITEAAAATDRTVLLTRKTGTSPCLRKLSDGETVVISRWPYRIGRLADQVDYCVKNPAVGRIHAELTRGQEGYFITDMNTRNGTYVNGMRIEPNTGHPIKNGDRIRLANEEFEFFE